MDIYYSESNARNGNLTPAQRYVATSDFAAILADMEAGHFPVGTGQLFPVNFDAQGQQQTHMNLGIPQFSGPLSGYTGT